MNNPESCSITSLANSKLFLMVNLLVATGSEIGIKCLAISKFCCFIAILKFCQLLFAQVSFNNIWRKFTCKRKIFFTYNRLIVRTGQYAKRVINKTNGLVDITLFSLLSSICPFNHFIQRLHASLIHITNVVN